MAHGQHAHDACPHQVRSGITYKQLPRDFNPNTLFEFNKKHGSTPLNYIPEGPVKEHFGKVITT